MRLLRFFSLALVAAAVLLADSSATQTKLTGVLIDELGSHKAETRVVSNSGRPHLEGGMIVAYAHTREEALKSDAQESGYGVFTYDQTFVPFDNEGNKLALQYLRNSKQESDFRVEVTGGWQNGKFHPQKIQPLP